MGGCPTRANEASISSCVRFFERRKEIFCSRGAVETEGSWRTAHKILETIDDHDRIAHM